MATLIFQVAVGEVPPFYKLCMDSVKNYANRIGSDYVVLTEPILKIAPLKSKRSENALRLGYLPIYEKENAFADQYLSKYDKIAIIDADIFIRDTAPNIFDELGDHTFGAVAERDMPLTSEYVNKIRKYSQGQYSSLTDVDWKFTKSHGHEFFNMGLMVFNTNISQYLNNQTPEQFLRRKEFERFINGDGNWKWSTDQTLLNYWVKKSGMSVKNLDWKWNGLFKGIQDQHLRDCFFIHFFLSKNLPRQGAEIPEIIADLDKSISIKGHK